MSRMPDPVPMFRATACLLWLALASAGCAREPARMVTVTWVVGQPLPVFDPQGPADPVRAALERLVSRGLVEERPDGRVVLAAAESLWVTPDSLVFGFRLPASLKFVDDTPCTSEDFAQTLLSGLNRVDHGTYRWLFSAVSGAERVRPGRPLPPVAIATPDPRTLVVRLSRRDPGFLAKLALPGACAPWPASRPPGRWVGGNGDYRVVEQTVQQLVLVRRARNGAAPDTVRVRFAPSPARARALMRSQPVDLLWPLPAGLLGQSLPEGYRLQSAESRPARQLLLVMRADLRPTAKSEARHAFAHGIRRSDLSAALGPLASGSPEWFTGGGPAEAARYDVSEVRAWLERGNLGRSVHGVLLHSLDGVGPAAARILQNDWAQLALDVELRAKRGGALKGELLSRGGAQLQLVESQPVLEDARATVASWITPSRGPVVGTFRTGWVDRDLEGWAEGAGLEPPIPLETVVQRLSEEQVVVPLARLPWVWIQPEPGPATVAHPRYGPDPLTAVTPLSDNR